MALVPTAPLRLSSRRHPVVRACRELAASRRPDTPRVLLDGAHLLGEALHAGLPVEHVLVSAAFLDRATAEDRALLDEAARAGAAVHQVTPAVMDAASPVRTPTGIVAIARWTSASLEAVYGPPSALVLGLVDVQDPGNLGAAIRSAAALGATGVVALDRSADPGSWKALRGAMGGTFRMPVGRASTADALAAARARGLSVLATSVDGRTAIDQVDLHRPVMVLIGNEGAGLSPDTVAACDDAIQVSMREGANSLNAAVTAALIVYEARRQRGVRPRR